MTRGGDIHYLIEKLSHKLAEVRVPALRSIISKLDLGLVTIEDLCQEKVLFVKLLEWFNFDQVSHEELVLSLLNTLVQNKTSAEILICIGAVDFFSQLRPHIDDQFLADVDRLMHKLLTIQDVTFEEREFRDQTIPMMRHETAIKEPPSQIISNNTFQQESLMIKHHSCNLTTSETSELNFLRFSFFPWRPLTHSDKMVVESAQKSLSGADTNMIMLSCKFIREVLLSDFPPEIFIQQPLIVEAVFSLLKVKQRKNWDLLIEPLDVTKALTQLFTSRLSYVKDPNFHCPGLLSHGSTMGSNRISSSVVEDLSRSVSKLKFNSQLDASFCSQSTIEGPFKGGISEAVDDDDGQDLIIEEFKSSQYSLPQFFASVLAAVQHMFQFSHTELLIRGFELSICGVQMLTETVDTTKLWSSSGSLLLLFRKDLEVFTHSVAIACKDHFEILRGMSNNISASDGQIQSQIALLDILALLLSKLAKHILPDVSLVNSTAHMEEIQSSAKAVIYNYHLSKFMPSIRSSLIASCLPEKSSDSERLRMDAEIHRSIESLGRVLKDGSDVLSNIKDIEESHLALQYTQKHFHIIDKLVETASDFCDFEDQSYRSVVSVLIHYLDSPCVEIRKYTYVSCQKFVEKCLEIEANVNTMASQPSRMLKFLLTEQLLTVFIQKGLLDSEKSIKDCASWILYQFLNSQLLFETESWHFFIDNFMHYFIFLQSLTSKETKLGQTLLSVVKEDKESTVVNLPSHDRLRGCLRLMFNTDMKVRIEAVGMLVWHLAKEPNAHSRLPNFNNATMPKLHNLLFPENQVAVDREVAVRINTKVHTLDSVLDIAQSEKLDEGVRKSGFDQVAILLQDPNIHTHFLDRKGLEYVEQILDSALEKSNYERIQHQYLPSVVSILRNLFFWQSSSRHRHSHNAHMLFNLVRGALVLNQNVGALNDTLFCLALLLFDEILMPGEEDVFSVPRIIRLHFKFPFTVEARDTVSEEDRSSKIPIQNRFPLSVSFLNDAYADNIATNDSLSKPEHPNVFYDIQLSIARSLGAIIGAQNHFVVTENLLFLKSYLIVAKNEPKLYAPYLSQIDFSVALDRFLSVVPSSYEDKKLLASVIDFVSFLLSNTQFFPEAFSWFDTLCSHADSLVLLCIKETSTTMLSEAGQESRLLESLLQCCYSFVAHKFVMRPIASAPFIISALIDRVKICDNADTYDLASLHMCLKVLALLTEIPDWANNMNESALSKMFPTLISIVSSFSTGRASSNLSFMGSGVIEKVFQIFAHLAREMARTFKSNCVWMDHWKMTLKDDTPFRWIISRLSHRNPRIRLLAHNLISQFCSVKKGQSLMLDSCSHIAGGLWTLLFEVSLDKSECCAVKSQALATLLLLTKDSNFPALQESINETEYTGPLIVDNLANVPVSGLRALEMLVESYEFFPNLAQALMQFFPFSEVRIASLSATPNSLEKFNMECCRIQLKSCSFEVGASEALATSPFVASLCAFAENVSKLLPDVAVKAFKSFNLYQSLLKLIDDSILAEIISNYKDSNSPAVNYRLRLLFHDLCTVNKSVVRLLTFVQCRASNLVPNASVLISTMTQFLCLLLSWDEQSNDSLTDESLMHVDLKGEFIELVGEISLCLRTLLTQPGASRSNLADVCSVLSGRSLNFSKQTMFVMSCFPKMTTEAGEFLNLVTYLVSKAHQSLFKIQHINDTEWSLMRVLCTNLMDQYQVNGATSAPNRTLELCLRAVLAFSDLAKKAAVDTEFIHKLIECLKTVHCKLTMMCVSSLNCAAAKEENFPNIIYSCLALLRNSMFEDESVKLVAHELGLTGVVSKLWQWCLTDATLFHGVLDCLQVYAARCHNAALSMSIQSFQSSSVSRHASSNTLVHLLIKAAQKETNAATATRTSLPLVNSIFSLLSTLSLTTECRGIMWKANFLQKFPEVTVPKRIPSQNSSLDDLFLCWLDLFLNVSFSSDGQQMIVKMNTSIDKIIEVLNMSFASSSSSSKDEVSSLVAHKCLVILHNLAFNVSNRPKLLANSMYLPTLMRVLSDSSSEQLILATSAAVWAVLYNNQKAKVAMKSATLLPLAQKKLSWVETQLRKDSRNARLFKANCYLQTIVTNLVTENSEA